LKSADLGLPVADSEHRTVSESVEGTDLGDFRAFDWGQLILAAGIFGSAFLWIALALRSIDPGTIAFGRAALGAAALGVLPSARCAVARVDWPRLTLAAFFGMAAPVLLFALAEERISSALAGMLVSGVPIFTAVLAAVLTRSWPTRRRLVGLLIGFVGIMLLAAPDLGSSGAAAAGVMMVLGAVLSYAVASTLYAPLQQTYGSLRVTMWLLVVSTAMLSPLGLLGLRHSSVEWLPLVSLLILGVVGTGAAWAMWVALIGRVGAVRAAIAGYIIPIVALVLGVVVLDEQIEPVQVVGVVVALSGGYLLSRGQRPAR
jgi:drug/metabolite transporter (DMT)-like permease